jgi:SAM-dependent methyltransferase
MTSIWYKHPVLYNLGMRLVHGKKLEERFRYIAGVIGRNKSVLDLGAGTCDLVRQLHRSCRYEAWDMNPSFCGYYSRRGINLKRRNILDFSKYPGADVIVLVDILHHVNPKHRILLKECIRQARMKVIVSEGYKGTETNRYYQFVKIRKMLKIDGLIGDRDGINDKLHDNNILPERELRAFLKEFGDCSIRKMGMSLVAVYEK